MRFLVLLLVLALGCEDAETKRRKKATREGKPLASAAQSDPSVKPVYPTKVGEVSPLVKRLCTALHATPRKRHAECCKSTVGAVLTSECERNAAAALAAGGVTMSEAAVAKCEAAMTAAHAGCEWVGGLALPTPPECRRLLVGTVEKNGDCRSTLECSDGMRCVGVGPTDAGKCGPPSAVGGLCGTAVDPLVVYTRQDDVDVTHPACGGGYCDRTRCRALVSEGGACTASVQCSGRCVGEKCVDGVAGKAGEGCSGGDCAFGLRCVSKVCAAPAEAGTACSADQQCLGACVSGKCAMDCRHPAIRSGIIKVPG